MKEEFPPCSATGSDLVFMENYILVQGNFETFRSFYKKIYIYVRVYMYMYMCIYADARIYNA